MSSYLFHPYTRFSTIENEKFPNIVKGSGVYLFDDNGKRYMDIISSWWACALGHNHPKIVQSIQDQTNILQHSITGSMTHPNVLELSKRLAHLMPCSNRHCLFASDGSSSIEAALKISLQYWHNKGKAHKKWLVGMDQAYHGDSLGALGVGFVDSFHAPYKSAVKNSLKLPFPVSSKEDPDGFLKTNKLITNHAEKIAAIIVEPLCLGSAGMKFYSDNYLKRLSDLCNEKEILLIVDEIAMGFGRTGKMFAFEHAGIDPDIVCVGKALTAGYMPLSSCIVKNEIYETFSDLGQEDYTFYHGNTYAGHPIGCAAALAAIETYTSENLIEQSHQTADFLKSELEGFKNLSCVKEVRSLHMIGVIELKTEFLQYIPLIKNKLRDQGYLFRPLGTTFYFMPPLIITIDELQEAVNAIKNILEEI